MIILHIEFVKMSDPWGTGYNCPETVLDVSVHEKTSQQFEDNFVQRNTSLPDSEQYLKTLEKKLSKLKNDPNILQQLSNKREECLRNLLNDTVQVRNDDVINYLNASIVNSNDSTVQEIYRHICPMQPLNVSEIVHIVKYDQLQEKYQVYDDQENKDHN